MSTGWPVRMDSMAASATVTAIQPVVARYDSGRRALSYQSTKWASSA